MKNWLFNKILFWFVTSLVTFSSVFAADVDHFEVELNPETAKVWEALDLTIKAVDKNNAVVTDYTWTVLIFSDTNQEATLPIVLKENTYTFKPSEQWVVKFENGVIFTKSWTQNIQVYDFNSESVFGVDSATISDSSSSATSEISFLSPENGLTIWEAKVKVSGSTVKNHKVNILLNGTENIETNSNSNWVFEKEITTLKNWENTLKAQVLNADWTVIWETSEIKVKVETNGLTIKSLKFIPESVLPESPYEIELLSNAWLKEVSVVINDSVVTLKETSEGLYKWNSFSPKNPWTYKVDVNLVNDLGHKLNELGVSVLTVKELPAAIQEEKKETEVVVSTWELNAPVERDPLAITWLKLVELKTKSVLTWDKIEWVKSYNVYKKNSSWSKDLVTTVVEPKFEIAIEWEKLTYEDFYVSANGIDSEWIAYEWVLSDPTKIKTWPELLIVLLISMFFAWMFLFFRWKKA